MIPARRGRIVNVIANIYRGFPGMAHTGAARAGVENLTMTLAVEWAQFGILVNAVAPGHHPVVGHRAVSAAAARARHPRDAAQARRHRARRSPRRSCSSRRRRAQFITGATLRLDGGQALWGHSWEIP